MPVVTASAPAHGWRFVGPPPRRLPPCVQSRVRWCGCRHGRQTSARRVTSWAPPAVSVPGSCPAAGRDRTSSRRIVTSGGASIPRRTAPRRTDRTWMIRRMPGKYNFSVSRRESTSMPCLLSLGTCRRWTGTPTNSRGESVGGYRFHQCLPPPESIYSGRRNGFQTTEMRDDRVQVEGGHRPRFGSRHLPPCEGSRENRPLVSWPGGRRCVRSPR